jgi:hypothetical protein
MAFSKKLFEEIRQSIQEAADLVNEGEVNAFDVGRELAYTKNCVEQAKEKITDAEKKEFEKYLPYELKAKKIQLAGGGMTWDYKHIPEWVAKKAELTEIEERAKSAFNAALKNTSSFDNETGAEILPAVGTPKKQSVSYR